MWYRAFALPLFWSLTAGFSALPAATLRTIYTEDPSWEIDPAGVKSIETHHLMTALSPTLVERNRRTRDVLPGLAKSFFWNGNELTFELRKDYKTVDDLQATTDDVIFSLKRLFTYKGRVAMPGRIDQYLCPLDRNECPNIVKIDDYRFKLILPTASPAYLDYLTDPTYGIVLRKTVDSKSGKITDHRNTLGAFYVASQGDKELVLKANDRHWAFSKDRPTEIRLLKIAKSQKTFAEQAVDLLLADQIDFIGVSPRLSPEQFDLIQKKLGNKGSYFVSDELNARYLLFTNKGLKIPVQNRQLLSKIIQEHVYKLKKQLGTYKNLSSEFLISGTFGSFRAEEFAKLESLRKALPDALPKDFRIKVGVKSKVWQEFLTENLVPISSSIQYIDTAKSTDELIKAESGDDIPDLIPLSSDIATVESYKTIGFFVDRKTFNIRDDAKGAKWIEQYTKTYEPEKRNAMYRELHFDSVVTNPSIIPMYTTPFRAVSSNGWRVDDFPTGVPGDYFWKVHK